MYHFRKSLKQRSNFPKPTHCPFCDEHEIARSKIVKAKYSFIIPNRVFYDLWELRDVVDHLMIIPNRHVKSFKELNEKEQLEIMQIIGEYESKNYNVYARGINNTQRSVEHQHTHLIKTKAKPPKASIFINKPFYWLKKF